VGQEKGAFGSMAFNGNGTPMTGPPAAVCSTSWAPAHTDVFKGSSISLFKK